MELITNMKLYLKLIILSLLLIYMASGTDKTVRAAQITNNQSNNADKQIIRIANISYPDKLTYNRGEKLDVTGLVVNAYYLDGSYETITDYEIFGFDSNFIGTQTVMVLYKNKMDTFTVVVLPEKPTNVNITDNGSYTISLHWDQVPGATRYDIYAKDPLSNKYVF